MHIKQHYNIELSRYKDAEKFMNRSDVSIAVKAKWAPEMKKITNKLSIMLNQIKDYSEDEALEGFAYEEEWELWIKI